MKTTRVSSDSIHAQENLMVGTYRNNHDVVLQEDLVSIWGGWTIGAFSNDLKQTKHKHVIRKCDPKPREF